MKKCFILLLSVLTLFMACSSKPPDSPDINEYFPFHENTMYHYSGTFYDYETEEYIEEYLLATMDVFNTYIKDGKIQRILIPYDFDVQTEVIEVKNNELRLINGDTYCYHFEDMTENEPIYNDVYLKGPFSVGSKWLSREYDNREAEIISMNTQVTVPYGTFDCMEARYTSELNNTVKTEYYAKGIGIVKTHYQNVKDQYEYSSELASVESDKALAFGVECFYPIIGSDEVTYELQDIAINTNYDLNQIINSILKAAPETKGRQPLLDEASSVKDMTFASNASAVLVNFSKDIYNREFTSPADEEMYLMCTAQTIGRMLSVSQVFLHVEGKPYSGKFVKLSEDDFFSMAGEQPDENALRYDLGDLVE